MAKSKNHTSHNQCKYNYVSVLPERDAGHGVNSTMPADSSDAHTFVNNLFLIPTARKAHRNGIRKPKAERYESLKGVCTT